MTAQNNAPGAHGKRAGAYRRIQHKGKEFYVSSRLYRVFVALRDEGVRSTLELMHALRIADPRSSIRDLRKMGIAVGDVWCQTPDGTRYKRYFIRKEAGNE